MNDLGRLRARLDGNVLTPGAAGYDVARRPAITRDWDVRPRAVVQCASIRDVARSITYARATGVRAVPRGGGHCFAGRSSTEELLLDLSGLDAITIEKDGRARVGGGARLAQVYDALHQHGRTIPSGCGPTVGMAGLTLGGGIGLLGRKHGFACDAVLSARVVLADGRHVECDMHREPELFWALRGAGGGQFGVVTSFVFATVAEPHATRFEMAWLDAAAAEVIAAWQRWAPDAPDDLTADLTILAEPGRPLRVIVFGAALRDPVATSDLLDVLVASSGVRPEIRSRGGMAIRDLKRSLAVPDPRADTTRGTTSRSEFFTRPLPAAAVGALLDELVNELSGRRELNFTAMGGAYNRVAPDATALVHRTERFLLQHASDENTHWVDKSWAIAHIHGSGGVYPNFPDPALDDWAAAYHGSNVDRLRAVKCAYDPDRFFHFPQAI